MFTSITAAGSLVVAALTAAAVADPDVGQRATQRATQRTTQPPPPGSITLEVVTVNGSGCRAGSAVVDVAADNTAFTVGYADYVAKAGVGAGSTDFRKNCQLSLVVHAPPEVTWGVVRADYRGYASLAAGATGLERASYYVQGTSPTAAVDHAFAGAYEGQWQATDVTDPTALVYAPCGADRNLNVNTELRVNVGSSDPTTTSSSMAMDSVDVAATSTYHLAWRQC